MNTFSVTLFVLSLCLIVYSFYREGAKTTTFENYKIDKEKELATLKYKLEEDSKMLQILNSDINSLNNQLDIEKGRSSTILSQKKSSEVRLGNYTEKIMPFLEGCPYSPEDLRFLGTPIDLVHFNLDAGEITFIEVKTGKSRPSTRQKTIKNIIASGKVYYAEMRLNEKGVKHKKYNNIE